MSFSSCYRYLLGLPTGTVTALVRGAIEESDTSGVPLTFREDGASLGDGSFTADVEGRVLSEEGRLPELRLTGDPLELVLHLWVRIEARVLELPTLDPVVYFAEFDLPGLFVRDESEAQPRLVIRFPDVEEDDLNVSMDREALEIPGELIQQLIEDEIGDDPDLLGPKSLPGQEIPDPENPLDTITVLVQYELYNDDPTLPGFRGEITGDFDAASGELMLEMPGHLKVQSIDEVILDDDMVIEVPVIVERVGDEMIARLTQVEASQIAVNFSSTTGPMAVAAGQKVATEVAQFFQALPQDPSQAVPSDADIESVIATRIVDYSSDLEVPVFTPAPPPTPDAIDLTSFDPTTIAQEALVLQLEPRNDGTPCDEPDPFTREEGFSLIVAAVAARPLLDQLVANTEGATREIQGHDVTVTDLSASLSDPGTHGESEGHIWVEGNAKVQIDCWPDAGVDFEGPVSLVPIMVDDTIIRFEADAGEFDAEDDASCEDVNPNEIAELIDKEAFEFKHLPNDFGGVGQLQMSVTEADIRQAGLTLHGQLSLTTLSQLAVGRTRKTLYWAHEAPHGS